MYNIVEYVRLRKIVEMLQLGLYVLISLSGLLALLMIKNIWNYTYYTISGFILVIALSVIYFLFYSYRDDLVKYTVNILENMEYDEMIAFASNNHYTHYKDVIIIFNKKILI